MIHSFSVENYRSIREETTLDLRIPGTAPDLPRFRQSEVRPDVRLPTAVVLMGPNGSGKTTLLHALISVATVIAYATPTDHPVNQLVQPVPFLARETRETPTSFRVETEANWLDNGSELFRYELSAYRGRIRYEALFHFPKNRPRRLFERHTQAEPIYVAHELGVTQGDDRLKAVREDASVIATLALLNVPVAMRIRDWTRSFLGSSNLMEYKNGTLSTDVIVDMIELNPFMKGWMEREIQRSDLAIHDFVVNEGVQGTKRVGFNHHGLDETVPLFLESAGTQRMFQLLPQIYLALTNGAPVVVDEIDGYLHVDVVSEILHRFQAREPNPHNAQIFVTSHNVGLLDDLEKEELFIVEKGEDGGTRVHGAQDVRGLRRDTRLYPKYRTGVLGGLPKIG